MSENVVYLIASILVLMAWAGTALFVTYYALLSNWRVSLVGRTLMSRAVSMLLLLTYALTSRWLDPVQDVQFALGLGVYALITIMEWRLFLVLRAVQTGKVTVQKPNYTPVRDWFRRYRRRMERS